MAQHKETKAYRLIYHGVKAAFPRFSVSGAENLPGEPCLMVGNHSQMYGPIAGELYTPGSHWLWCAGQMMEKNEVAEYAFNDFWTQKPKRQQPFYRVLSKLIVPLSVCVFNGAHCIPVYHDHRLYATFRETARLLEEGSSVVIFPENYTPYNNIINDFQEGFVDTALFVYRKTGKKTAFVPEYICPELRTLNFGKPVYFDPDRPLKEERVRIKKYLMEEITRMAAALPSHTVVPYANVGRKNYPKSLPLVSYEDKTHDL